MAANTDTADKILTPTKTAGEADAARGSLGSRVDELQNQVENLVRRTRERAVAVEGDVEKYVQEKPLKSLLIAAGVGAGLGLLLGALLARR